MKSILLVFAAAALIALGAVGGRVLNIGIDHPQPASAASTNSTTKSTTISPAPSVSAIDAAYEHAYKVASPSVVFIDSVGVGSGSGVIYDSTGDIVTNAHVVSGASSLKVTLNNGKILSARVLGTDVADDLAVIHIDATGLTAAHFAKAGTYAPAQSVLAIGNPLGLKQTVTSGLISGLDRTEQEPNGAYLPAAIQTSAPINPGNSGGALVTLDGTVVGIPTLEQTSSTDGSAAQAIGFAIPSPRVTLVANQIIATGKVEHTGRAFLGISLGDSSAASASPFGQGGSAQAVPGALVNRVASGSPADQAGLQQGDVITKFNSVSISSADDLLTVLSQEKPGSTVTLTLNRNGNTQTATVHLSEMPASK